MGWNWHHVKTFEAVAKYGGLSGAARYLGISAATAGRHITALEDQIGHLLFDRFPDGYALTSAGEALLPLASEMSATAAKLERKKSTLQDGDRGVVRIAAGNWISCLLLNRLQSLRETLPHAEFEVINSYSFASLARHDADIALRNTRPDKGRVVVRKLPSMQSAVYGRNDYVSANPAAMSESRYIECTWVGYDDELSNLPSARWLKSKRKKTPEVRCVQATNILDGLHGGLGLAVIPCWMGENDRSLIKVSDSMVLDGSEVWMLIHEDLRKVPLVRKTADWIVDTWLG